MARLDVSIEFNGQTYNAVYNNETGYYEVDLVSPSVGGIYPVDVTFYDFFNTEYTDTKNIQVLSKKEIKLNQNKMFMWIFDYKDFSVKDIVEISECNINVDEETNAVTICNILKKTTAKSKDIVFIKKNNEIIYWGKIEEIQNNSGRLLYQYSIKYITNIFDRKIKIGDDSVIKSTGIEDFIASEISSNFINSSDTFINWSYIRLNIKTHTTKEISAASLVDVEYDIYNLKTLMTNCTQYYNIVYSFNIVKVNNVWYLEMSIENKEESKILIDTSAFNITNYEEVFDTNVTSKVIVLTNTYTYTLYLLNDRTTTTDGTDVNRADGEIETIYTENYEDAPQVALDKIRENQYNHHISFSLFDRYIPIGTPIAIKTKDSLIYDTYISSVSMDDGKYISYICGNIRINFIDKLLKEKK